MSPKRARSVRTRPLLAFAALAMMVSAFRSDLQAQERRIGAELWGRVLQAGDTLALPGAVIEVVGLTVSATASPTGFYRLAGLTPGPRTVRVRRLGFQSVTLHVELEEGRAERKDVRLERLTILREVRIEGQVRKVPPRFEDVYRRMSTANGRFFTREDIERLNPPDIQSLLMQVGTVRVNFNGIVFPRCNEAGALALSPDGGKVQIYIDGLRMTGRNISNRPLSNRPLSNRAGGDGDAIAAEQREVLRRVMPTQIQAVEVYSGVSRIPGEFLEDACAVIAIWTRSY